MERNEDSIPEPILRLRKTSALRLLRSFDHSGEETTRVYDDAMGEKESNGDGGGDTSGASSAAVMRMGTPPVLIHPLGSVLRYVPFCNA